MTENIVENKQLAEVIGRLRTVGLRPGSQLVQRILAHEGAARTALISVATELETLHLAAPACWAPLHALRLLGELPHVEIVEPLLGVLPVEMDSRYDYAASLWAEDVLEVIAHCGVDALPVLWEWIDNTDNNDRSRGAALQSLAYIAQAHPDVKEETVGQLRERLTYYLEETEEQNPPTFLSHALAGLQVRDVYSQIMAAYKAGRINVEVLPASTMRQTILSKPDDIWVFDYLPLWDRYDELGPFPEPEEPE